MIDLNEFAKEVHANAVEHGWYDNGERSEEEIFANIHSEWSEAFDAYAHGLPWYYHHCGDPATKDEICENFADCYSRKIGWDGGHCFLRNKKPEGIAVELIDGVIRILDYAGYIVERGFSPDMCRPSGYKEEEEEEVRNRDFCDNICALHAFTNFALEEHGRGIYDRGLGLMIFYVFTMVNMVGLDPEAIMIEKHEYNKTRPYRHGGKVV